MENEHRIFVYGTLKKGYPNNYILKSGEYLCSWTLLDYIMLDFGAFPVIVPSIGYKVEGEIYKVNESVLRELDLLEGVDRGLYIRKEVDMCVEKAEKDKKASVTAFVYVYGGIMGDGVW